jgi:hypothetical protein
MLLKCYHYLHLVGESESDGAANHEDDYRLDIFQMTTNNNEPSW